MGCLCSSGGPTGSNHSHSSHESVGKPLAHPELIAQRLCSLSAHTEDLWRLTAEAAFPREARLQELKSLFAFDATSMLTAWSCLTNDPQAVAANSLPPTPTPRIVPLAWSLVLDALKSPGQLKWLPRAHVPLVGATKPYFVRGIKRERLRIRTCVGFGTHMWSRFTL